MKKDAFRNQEGSASVLVIMLSLTLIVFGVFSMMTAYAGLAAARRYGEWNQKHYQLESNAAIAASQLHLLVEEVVESVGVTGRSIDKEIEREIADMNLPVTLVDVIEGENPGKSLLVFDMTIAPINEQERTAFIGILQVQIDVNALNEPKVTVEQTTWQSVTEVFEYNEHMEFRDLEVDTQGE